MDFKKKMKQRLYIAVSYIVVGMILLASGLISGTENLFITAFGISLSTMGILRVAQYRKITRSSQTLRKQELTENDERNRMMADRARSWAFSLSMLVAGIVVILLSLLGRHEEALPFAWYVCAMTAAYAVIYAIVEKKY